MPLTRLLLAEAPEAPEQAGVLFITLAAPASAPAEAAAAAGGEGGDATIALALNFESRTARDRAAAKLAAIMVQTGDEGRVRRVAEL